MNIETKDIREVLNTLGFAGTTLILWTVIVGVALFSSEPHVITWLWPTLYGTWLGIAILWPASGVVAALIARSRLGAFLPPIAVRSPAPGVPGSPTVPDPTKNQASGPGS